MMVYSKSSYNEGKFNELKYNSKQTNELKKISLVAELYSACKHGWWEEYDGPNGDSESSGIKGI